jgi:acetaldehyde dehydrogenase (acetylating)
MAQTADLTDRDQASIEEARRLAHRAKQAAPPLAELSQEQIDRIVGAMADAVRPRAEALAKLAVEETGFGVVADKVQKNRFAAERVYEFIRPIKTVGVINRDEARKVVEIAEPFGVVAAIVPSTNPTSTAIYKILIALKARCPIVISPHPSAARFYRRPRLSSPTRWHCRHRFPQKIFVHPVSGSVARIYAFPRSGMPPSHM